MTRIDQAFSKFSEGYNCAQSVLYPFCDEFQIDEDIALKMSCGFGAGIGRMQEVCGAVTGGIIAIGLKYGRGKNDDNEAKELTYAKTREFMERFSDKYGTYVCRKLLNDCQLTTEEGQRYFKENDLLNKACRLYVESAVEILERIIK